MLGHKKASIYFKSLKPFSKTDLCSNRIGLEIKAKIGKSKIFGS
jgi:hypothetical protein